MSNTLRSESLVKIYKKRKVVNKASVQVSKGEIVGLLGPNGAGKTTTFYMITGMIKPDAGKVFLDDEEITKIPMYKRARMGIGYLPQEASIFRRLTVEENLLAVLEMTNLDKESRIKKCDTLLNELSINQIRKSKGFQLSGGERRRTEIARALATDPSFILLDEPFAGIDPLAVIDIKNIIVHLKKRGIGILISDHNVRETLEVCDKAYILSDGKIIESGKPEQIVNSETARRIYLGDEFKL